MNPSRCRQRLHRLITEASKFIKIICAHPPLVKGTVYRVETKCGKSGCRCEQADQKHKSWKITRSHQGKSQTRCVSLRDLHKYKRMSRNYQQFRKAREQVVKNHKEQIELINDLESGRRIEDIWEVKR